MSRTSDREILEQNIFLSLPVSTVDLFSLKKRRIFNNNNKKETSNIYSYNYFMAILKTPKQQEMWQKTVFKHTEKKNQ